jgi:acyl carrier protein
MLSVEIENKIKEILSSVFDISEEINCEDELINIGMDSIKFVKLVVIIENEFNLQFPFEDIDFNRFSTIKDLIYFVESKLL